MDNRIILGNRSRLIRRETQFRMKTCSSWCKQIGKEIDSPRERLFLTIAFASEAFLCSLNGCFQCVRQGSHGINRRSFGNHVFRHGKLPFSDSRRIVLQAQAKMDANRWRLATHLSPDLTKQGIYLPCLVRMDWLSNITIIPRGSLTETCSLGHGFENPSPASDVILTRILVRTLMTALRQVPALVRFALTSL